ncbi:hypothetical protein GGF42_000937, partial [Coemansia sp. RSA 2424]
MNEEEPWNEEHEELRLQSMRREREAASAGEHDYYAVLNVARSATTEDIREAYRRLSRLFHPDRHHDAEKQEWARRQFHVIQRAHEVLTDPPVRAAYDQLGEQGISMGKAVGYKLHSMKDLQDRFEREARLRRLEDVDEWVQSQSEITLSVDGSPIASPHAAQTAGSRLGRSMRASGGLALQQLLMNHSFTASLSDSVAGTVEGRMLSKGSKPGAASGAVKVKIKRTLGPQTWASFAAPVLPPYVVAAEAVHCPSLGTFYQANVEQHALDMHTPPAITLRAGRPLSQHTAAFMSVATGNQYALGSLWKSSPTRAPRQLARVPRKPSSVSIGLTGARSTGEELGANVTASSNQAYLQAWYKRKLDMYFSVSGGVVVVGHNPRPMPATAGDIAPATSLSLGDISVNVDMVGEIDRHTKLGWKVDLGLASGVTVTIYLRRFRNCVNLPILLTPMLELELAIYASAIPMAAALALHYFVLKPRRRLLIQRQMEMLKDEQRYQLSQQQRQAQEAVRLMKDSVARARKQALAVNGLVIEEALYGDLPFGIASQDTNALRAAIAKFGASRTALSAADEPRACDVAVALHALVVGDQLVIAGGGGKQFLPGFYDPTFGAPKSLFVRYRFKGKMHEVIVKDDQALAIPMREHCVDLANSSRARLLHSPCWRRHYTAKNHYDETVVYKYASQKINPVSIGQLLKYRRQPLSAENILDSVGYTQAELPVRLAKRVISFHKLPFIVGTNPHIARVYN